MEPASYKKLQEAWVSGNSGTSWQEISVILCQLPLSAFFACVLFKKRSFLLDFIIIVIPTILNFNNFFPNTNVIPIVLFGAAAIYTIFIFVTSRNQITFVLRSPPEYPIPWLTNMRALIYLATSICILAVDFVNFPRRFAKTETFGYGLMDVGVGLFVVCNGILARRYSLSQTFKGTLVLFGLGFLRLASTISVDYHGHDTEYGRHWNFFFTLAMCRIVSSFLEYLLPFGPGMLALMTMGAHQATLHYGLQTWVLNSNSRHNLMYANKEGISSILGYIALYYSSFWIGEWTLNMNKRATLLVRSIAIFAVTWYVFIQFSGYFGVSRRLCNIGYIAWMLALTATFMLQLVVIDIVISMRLWTPKSPRLLVAINRYGLLFFLLSNVLTGLININFQTLVLSVGQGYGILVTYSFIVCYTMYFMQDRNVKIHF